MTRTKLIPRTVTEFIESSGTAVNEKVLVAALMDLEEQGWLSDAPPPLTEAETSFLDEHGGVGDDRTALQTTRLASGLRAASAQRQGLTVEQTAKRLNVSTSRVRHRLGDGSLYAYPSKGRGTARTLPAWQFDDGLPIPHLAEVLHALPEGLTPTEVRDFALNATVDHPVRDVSVPLLDWLRTGGDPAAAIELARAQARLI